MEREIFLALSIRHFTRFPFYLLRIPIVFSKAGRSEMRLI